MPATHNARARTPFQRAWEIAARIAAAMLALYLIVPLLASSEAFAGFDASVSGIIVSMAVVAAFGALPLIARRNGRVQTQNAPPEERNEEVADRQWELREGGRAKRAQSPLPPQ